MKRLQACMCTHVLVHVHAKVLRPHVVNLTYSDAFEALHSDQTVNGGAAHSMPVASSSLTACRFDHRLCRGKAPWARFARAQPALNVSHFPRGVLAQHHVRCNRISCFQATRLVLIRITRCEVLGSRQRWGWRRSPCSSQAHSSS